MRVVFEILKEKGNFEGSSPRPPRWNAKERPPKCKEQARKTERVPWQAQEMPGNAQGNALLFQ